MRYLLIFSFIFFFNFSIQAIEIDEKSSNISILGNSSIYLDKKSDFNFEEIQEKNFTQNSKPKLDFGLTSDTTLWIRFVLHNKSSKSIKKIVVYQSTEMEEICFYDLNQEIKRGLYHIPKENKTIHPHFDIQLKPYEERVFYIKAHSKMRALSAKISLWNREAFIKEDYSLKMVLLLFFGVILTLFIYNFMLWRFTKDKVYLFYIFYLLGILSFEANYYGLYALYIFPLEIVVILEKGIISILAIMAIFFILFAQEFLQLKQFKRLHSILTLYLYLIPITAILAYDNQILNTNILLLYVSVAPLLIYSGIYALRNGIKEAHYYLIGWSPVIISIIVVVLQFVAIFDIKNIIPYILEFAFISESLIFSIALAHKIEITKEEKVVVDKKLTLFQNEEKKRLQKLVAEKTKALSISLKEKEILYKELNHRIKNNLMMILSLLKLQIRRTTNSETKASLKITKNRIESISSLYEILLLKNESINADTHIYLQGICNNIAMGSIRKIKINYDIQLNLETDSLIYIGLIVNELITNSFKYAFDDDNGEIMIKIEKKENSTSVSIADNGKGFKEKRKNSLGLTIVEILVEGQLQGVLKIDATEGTKVLIEW